MKSMLQEASSVLKAIEKAWTEAGKPQEFTIKILEEGEKGFLGLTGGRPAVISISYHPTREVKKGGIDFGKKLGVSKDQKISGQPLPAEKTQKPTKILDSIFNKKAPQKVDRPIVKKEQMNQQQKEKINIWRNEFVDDVSVWLKEMMRIMGVEITVNFRHDQKILNIFIDKRVFKDSEEEKLFFISLSHLLMQFLKKKYKKKFANYYLIIHSKIVDNNDNRKSMPSNK